MAVEGLIALPIKRRGLFSQDSFFQDFQKDYSTAVEDVMNRWSGRSLLADQFSSYRQLRQQQPQDDTQAASISDTKENYVVGIYFFSVMILSFGKNYFSLVVYINLLFCRNLDNLVYH